MGKRTDARWAEEWAAHVASEGRACPAHGMCDFAEELEAEITMLEAALSDAKRDAERLRGGLQWYAEGHHYDLPDWEDCSGESANWIFPPNDEVIGSHSWMIDDGGIAKAILDGSWINPNHIDADLIVIGPVKTPGDHAAAMSRVEELMPNDPAADTAEGKELLLLAQLVEEYETAALAAKGGKHE